MRTDIILALIIVLVASGIILTRLRFRRRTQGAIAERLARVIPQFSSDLPTSILKKPTWSFNSLPLFGSVFEFELGLVESYNQLLSEADLEEHALSILLVSIALAFGAMSVAILYNFNMIASGLVAIVLAAAPIIFVKFRAGQRRDKFCTQLPDAIDLMVAVLRSGHSVSQSVKAIAQELPSPTGPEFEAVLHRMNLGQPLSEALIYSAKRFRSYELDLMRRAVGIQAEVGGSLAELLDKTNSTLRGRVKLARQLKVITAQSRLSAYIVGLLPIVMAIFLNFADRTYLPLLMNDPTGQKMLMGAVFLEFLGIYIMFKMSTLKI